MSDLLNAPDDVIVVAAASASTPRRHWRGAVIVPAHNESTRIRPLLDVLSQVARDHDVWVVVVCNGCSDDTEAVARRYDDVLVLVSPHASKTHALNVGDTAVGDVFPRLYVDADADVNAASILALLEALRVETPLAVRPSTHHDLTRSSWPVRQAARLPFLVPALAHARRDHLEGHAVYGTNRAGRQRFDTFPDLIADDTFFDRMFAVEEKMVVDEATVTIREPDDLRTYLRAMVRICQGNLQLDQWLKEHRPTRTGVVSSLPWRKLRGVRLRHLPVVAFGLAVRRAAHVAAWRRTLTQEIAPWR